VDSSITIDNRIDVQQDWNSRVEDDRENNLGGQFILPLGISFTEQEYRAVENCVEELGELFEKNRIGNGKYSRIALVGSMKRRTAWRKKSDIDVVAYFKEFDRNFIDNLQGYLQDVKSMLESSEINVSGIEIRDTGSKATLPKLQIIINHKTYEMDLLLTVDKVGVAEYMRARKDSQISFEPSFSEEVCELIQLNENQRNAAIMLRILFSVYKEECRNWKPKVRFTKIPSLVWDDIAS